MTLGVERCDGEVVEAEDHAWQNRCGERMKTGSRKRVLVADDLLLTDKSRMRAVHATVQLLVDARNAEYTRGNVEEPDDA